MAAAKMLTQMLRSDNIPYAIRAVSNFDDVIFTIQNNLTPDIKTVFMINCGAVGFLFIWLFLTAEYYFFFFFLFLF